MAKKTVARNIQTVLKTMVLPPPDAKLDLTTVTKIEGKLSNLFFDDFYSFEDAGEEIERLQKQFLAAKKHLEMAKAGFRKLNYTFLSWCGENRLPAFVILSIDSNHFEVTVEPRHSKVDNIDDVAVDMNPNLCQTLLHQFDEAFITLGRLSSEKFEDEALTISAKFQGFVPTEARKIIDSVYNHDTFDDIYIICDAPADWQPKQTGQISMRDPLVVGWDEESGTMYLITTFDPITLEEYLLTSPNE